MVRRLHAVFAARGVHMLDAPVSGGPRGAEAGKLALWVGGDEDVFKQVQAGARRHRRPALLRRPDRRRLGRQARAQLRRLHDPDRAGRGLHHGREGRRRSAGALEGGAPGRPRPRAAPSIALADQFLPGKFDPPSFALRLAHKDVSLATALGREHNVPMRIANLTLEEMTEALNRGWGERDSRVAMLLQEERAGVEIKVPAAALKEVLDGDKS